MRASPFWQVVTRHGSREPLPATPLRATPSTWISVLLEPGNKITASVACIPSQASMLLNVSGAFAHCRGEADDHENQGAAIATRARAAKMYVLLQVELGDASRKVFVNAMAAKTPRAPGGRSA